MSPSTTSKSASRSSRETGAAADKDKDKHYREDDPKRAPIETVEIELEASRQRQIGWAIGGTLIGVLLVLKLGTVGVWTGYLLIALGVYRAYQLVQSYRHPVGTIVVSPEQVKLPRGLHRGAPVEAAPSEVTAVYFLRRSVPWNRAAPVLVVELGERAMIFPRDWFASEADQRHVVHALLTHCPIKTVSEPA
ncbi:MAG: hypothetical protein ACM31C_02395 [Acidobacteriota bacterium]